MADRDHAAARPGRRRIVLVRVGRFANGAAGERCRSTTVSLVTQSVAPVAPCCAYTRPGVHTRCAALRRAAPRRPPTTFVPVCGQSSKNWSADAVRASAWQAPLYAKRHDVRAKHICLRACAAPTYSTARSSMLCLHGMLPVGRARGSHLVSAAPLPAFEAARIRWSACDVDCSLCRCETKESSM